jgi:hypothetical protein
MKTREEAKKEFEAVLAESQKLSADESITDDYDPRFVEMLERLNKASDAYFNWKD